MKKFGWLLFMGLAALSAAGFERVIDDAWDIARTPRTPQEIYWLQAESIQFNLSAYSNGDPYAITNENATFVWEITDYNNWTNVYSVSTGTLYDVTNAIYRFELTPEQSNLTNGTYSGYARAVITDGTNVTDMIVLARQTIGVAFSPAGLDYQFVGYNPPPFYLRADIDTMTNDLWTAIDAIPTNPVTAIVHGTVTNYPTNGIVVLAEGGGGAAITNTVFGTNSVAPKGANISVLGNYAANASTGLQYSAMGYYAGASVTGGYWTAIGSYAGYLAKGTDWTAIGFGAGYRGIGSYWTALGESAGDDQTGGQWISIGYEAGMAAVTTNGIAIGTAAGQSSSGNSWTAVGEGAGAAVFGPGNYWTAIGAGAGGGGTTGNYWTALGYYAGNDGSGDNKISVGRSAGYNAFGSDLIAVGYEAGASCDATSTISIGRRAGYGYTYATNVVSLGNYAGRSFNGSNAIILESLTADPGSTYNATNSIVFIDTLNNIANIGRSNTTVNIRGDLNITGDLTLQDTVWKDLQISALSLIDPQGPITAARLVQVTNAMYGLEFVPSNIGIGKVQMTHEYKTNTVIRPHLHTVNTNATPTTNTWSLALSWGRIGQAITNHWTSSITVTNTAATNGIVHQIHSFGDVTNSVGTVGPSTVFGLVVSNASVGVNGVLLDIDIHYEADKLGSDNESPNGN